jgi:hypothetical protein
MNQLGLPSRGRKPPEEKQLMREKIISFQKVTNSQSGGPQTRFPQPVKQFKCKCGF